MKYIVEIEKNFGKDMVEEFAKIEGTKVLKKLRGGKILLVEYDGDPNDLIIDSVKYVEKERELKLMRNKVSQPNILQKQINIDFVNNVVHINSPHDIVLNVEKTGEMTTEGNIKTMKLTREGIQELIDNLHQFLKPHVSLGQKDNEDEKE